MDDWKKACRMIRRALDQKGPLSAHAIGDHTGTSRRSARSILAHLTDQDEVHSHRIGRRTLYTLKTTEVRDCDCDGTCMEQADLLSLRPVRRLWTWLRRHSPCDSTRLNGHADACGLTRSVLYHNITRLLDAQLLQRVEAPHGDRRRGWYHAKDPLPSANAILRGRVQTIGQTDEDSSTAEDSFPLGHR